MTDLTLWLLTVALFACVYVALTFTPASEMPWQMKSVIWSNVGLLAFVLLSSDSPKH